MYEYLGAWDRERGLIEVKLSKEACMSRQFWLESVGPGVVKCDVVLWEKVVPFAEGKGRTTG